MIGKTSDLDRLRSALEAALKYETMGHTRMCQKAFPPRWDGDHGSDSRAQAAVNIWRQNSKASESVERLRRELVHGYMQTYATPAESDMSICVLENMTTGDVIRVEHRYRLHAYLIAILKVLLKQRQNEEGVLCMGCGDPAVKLCEVNCGDALCGSPVCDKCIHFVNSKVGMARGWSHVRPDGDN